MQITIIGQGAWGRALCGVAQRLHHQVDFLSHLSTAWPADRPDYVFLALPVQHLRDSLLRLSPPGVPVLSLSKGLEIESGQRVSEIVGEVWGEQRVGALSGPTFAAEVAQGLPATCTLAALDDRLAADLQTLLHQPNFRIYRSSDLIGVELGGALKNIYAIAAGACHGLALGQNSLAGLLTRCLAEMTRIGVLAGAKVETFAGLSGMGDLILTATSEQSRNFRFGQLLARGLSRDEILPKLEGVCEGLPTTRSVYLNSAIPLETKPIVTQLHSILYEGKPPLEAVRHLLERAAREE